MHERRNLLSFEVEVDKYVLVDAVIIPFVVRRHLIGPTRHACIQVACEDRHRPLVVSRTLRRIPGTRIAGAVISEIELRIVGIPPPRRATTELPLIAFPGLQRRVLADRRHLAVRPSHRLLRVDQDLVVRPGAPRRPRALTGLYVVRNQSSAYAEFTTAVTGDHLVLDDMRCFGVRLADLWVPVLSSPDRLAGVRIECHLGRIGLLEKDLAVTEGEPSIHCVAAHDRYDARILLRLVLPLEGEVLQV